MAAGAHTAELLFGAEGRRVHEEITRRNVGRQAQWEAVVGEMQVAAEPEDPL